MTQLIRFSFVVFGLGMFVFLGILHFRGENTPAEQQQTVATEENIKNQGIPEEGHRKQAILIDVTENLSFGLATHKAVGGNFVIMISAQLPPPPDGLIYYGWFVSDTPGQYPISLGELTKKPEDKNFWEVTFLTSAPIVGYNAIWVTHEPEFRRIDEPGTAILKGELKTIK